MWPGGLWPLDRSVSAASGPPLSALSTPLPCRAVENEAHCDFVKLREMLIRVNMEDLREQTHSRHYELYRRCKLEEMGFKDTDPDSKPFRYPSSQPGPPCDCGRLAPDPAYGPACFFGLRLPRQISELLRPLLPLVKPR